MPRKQHRVRQTLLVVGEGDSEEAFLKHLRELYCSGGAGVRVTIRNAHGKGPENVIDHTIKQADNAAFDQCASLLDTDLPWSDALKKRAKKAHIQMIGSTPCLEGLLLSILEQRPPSQSSDCKRMLHKLLGTHLTERDTYAPHFTQVILEKARHRIPELDRLLGLFEGR